MPSRLHKRLDKIYSTRDNILTLRPEQTEKFIVFSDFHRGLSDHADDFKDSNEISYRTALSHYYHNDYTLIHLGDVEELKEQFIIKKVMTHHDILQQMEMLFHQKNQFYKVWGNHDSQWGNHRQVKKHLHPIFPGIVVYEGIIMEFEDLPKIFLVHGHQGYSWMKTNVAEKFVLPIWKFGMNLFGIQRKIGYENYCRIEKTEQEFYDWVVGQEDLLLIFGHTHRPLWGSSTHIEKLEKELEQKRKELEDIADIKGETVRQVIDKQDIYNIRPLVAAVKEIIQKIQQKMKESGTCRSPIPLPVLFNTGNCIFEDGDITGIEIEDHKMKLVKWGKNGGPEVIRQELEAGDLSGFRIV
jgi:predicted phosphodiesterase